MASVAPGMAVKIVNEETNEPCGPNEIGEITVKSPITMKSYLNRPEANVKFFDQDGFVQTGDLGSYDETGKLTFEGRLKELIKYKNIHMYPLEIENFICSHPDVVDVGVFGRPEPSVQELVTAIVVKKPNSTVTEQGGHHVLWIVELRDESRDSTHLKLVIFFYKKITFITQKYDEQIVID